MAWDEEAMLRRYVWGYAHRYAQRLWITASRRLDRDDESDYREVMESIRFELGQGALDGLDPGLVREEVRGGMTDRVPHW